jgi:ATP-dependent helicase HepA
METEVQRANSFAAQIVKQDERARSNAIRLLGWITRGLSFNQRRVDEDIFTLQFSNRTRLDARSFIKHCLEGLDLENSDYRNPRTHPMSFDRMAAVSAGHVYPFRFGQPFVDTIWNLSIQDPRAISTACLRIANEFQEPGLSLYFKLSWLVEAVDANQPRWKRRRGDDWLRPRVKTLWLNEFGNEIEQEKIVLLSKPYAERGNGYQDLNLNEQKWSLVREWGEEFKWREVVRSLGDKSTGILEASISVDQISKPEGMERAPNLQLVSVNAFFLASRVWVQEMNSRLSRGKFTNDVFFRMDSVKSLD